MQKYVCVRSDANPALLHEIQNGDAVNYFQNSVMCKQNLWVRSLYYCVPLEITEESFSKFPKLFAIGERPNSLTNFPLCIQIFHSIPKESILLFVDLLLDSEKENKGELVVKVPVVISPNELTEKVSYLMQKIETSNDIKITVLEIRLDGRKVDNDTTINEVFKNVLEEKTLSAKIQVDPIFQETINYRVSIVNKILEGEKKFVNDLEKIITFWQPNTDDLELFSGCTTSPYEKIRQMIEVHSVFLEQLNENKSGKNYANSSLFSAEFGYLFFSFVQKFSKSVEFLSEISDYVNFIESNCYLDETNDKLNELSAQCDNVTFQEFMKKPKFHYFSYLPFLIDLQRKTPKCHPDHLNLSFAVKEVEKMLAMFRSRIGDDSDEVKINSLVNEMNEEEEEVSDDKILALSEEVESLDPNSPSSQEKVRMKQLQELEFLLNNSDNENEEDTDNKTSSQSAKNLPKEVTLELNIANNNSDNNNDNNNNDNNSNNNLGVENNENLSENLNTIQKSDSVDKLMATINENDKENTISEKINDYYLSKGFKRRELPHEFSDEEDIDDNILFEEEDIDEEEINNLFYGSEKKTAQKANNYENKASTQIKPINENKEKDLKNAQNKNENQAELIPMDNISFQSLDATNPEIQPYLVTSEQLNNNVNEIIDDHGSNLSQNSEKNEISTFWNDVNKNMNNNNKLFNHNNNGNNNNNGNKSTKSERPFNYGRFFDDGKNSLFNHFFGTTNLNSNSVGGSANDKMSTSSSKTANSNRQVFLRINNTKVYPKRPGDTDNRSIFASPVSLKKDDKFAARVMTPEERQRKIDAYSKEFDKQSDVNFTHLSTNQNLKSPPKTQEKKFRFDFGKKQQNAPELRKGGGTEVKANRQNKFTFDKNDFKFNKKKVNDDEDEDSKEQEISPIHQEEEEQISRPIQITPKKLDMESAEEEDNEDHFLYNLQSGDNEEDEYELATKISFPVPPLQLGSLPKKF